MRITQEADYALRVILYLTRADYGAKVDASTIAESEGIPLRFLLKLLRKLIHPGIIKSFRGVNGGYALNRLPEEISLKDVIEAIDGPICVNRCLTNPEVCNAKKNGNCDVHKALQGIQKNLFLDLGKINFKDLSNR